MLSEVRQLLHTTLTIPVTSATAELPFVDTMTNLFNDTTDLHAIPKWRNFSYLNTLFFVIVSTSHVNIKGFAPPPPQLPSSSCTHDYSKTPMQLQNQHRNNNVTVNHVPHLVLQTLCRKNEGLVAYTVQTRTYIAAGFCMGFLIIAILW